MPEVITEMRRRGTGYADRTNCTMIRAHWCVESTGDGVGRLHRLTRVGFGRYQFSRLDTP